MSAVDGLDALCMVCHRRSGDHTLDEWATCMDTPNGSLHLPYEEVQAGPVKLTVGDRELPFADHLIARSSVVTGQAGALEVMLPAVIFTFQIGRPSNVPTPVAEIAFISNPDIMRKTARVLRDTCNAAANAAEKIGG